MIAEPLEKGLAEDIENEVVQITWNRYGTCSRGGFERLFVLPCCLQLFDLAGQLYDVVAATVSLPPPTVGCLHHCNPSYHV